MSGLSVLPVYNADDAMPLENTTGGSMLPYIAASLPASRTGIADMQHGTGIADMQDGTAIADMQHSTGITDMQHGTGIAEMQHGTGIADMQHRLYSEEGIMLSSQKFQLEIYD